MTSGWTMLAIGTLICIGLFANGVRFARKTRSIGRVWPEGGRPGQPSPRQIGRIFMIAAPLFWLFWAAMCFGLLGPIENIQTIQLH
jgi:hypothetical protein